jgi:hypothetical protein
MHLTDGLTKLAQMLKDTEESAASGAEKLIEVSLLRRD